MNDFEFLCSCCGKMHSGIMNLVAEFPNYYYTIPENERESRVDAGSDDCIIDEEFFFVRGCIDIPIIGQDQVFSWGVWLSLSHDSFLIWLKHFNKAKRSHMPSLFGWLQSELGFYEDSTINLKTRVHFRDNGMRPYVEMEPTQHPLSFDQQNGMSKERLIEIYENEFHPHGSS